MLAKRAGVEDWVKVGDYSSISHYNAGIKDAPEEDADKKQLVYSVGKRVAFRYYGKPIYYPSERAIFDLHIPAGIHYVFHGAICVSTGIIRAINERDIREILFEDHSDFFGKDLIQDMEHPTDLYVVDKVL